MSHGQFRITTDSGHGIITSVEDAASIERIIYHHGEPPRPLLSPVGGRPAVDDAAQPVPDWDLFSQSELDFEQDHRIAW